MPRTFAYLRVSTAGQTTDNQLQEIKAAGFKVEPRRVITETISGNVATSHARQGSGPLSTVHWWLSISYPPA
jgi:putative DNA-invertase from lambdoid prophage Rac